MTNYNSRPLLPSDEDNLNNKLYAKRHAGNAPGVNLPPHLTRNTISTGSHAVVQNASPTVSNANNNINILHINKNNNDNDNDDSYDSDDNTLNLNKRSASNRNMNEFYSKNSKDVMQKALTDTNNFIEIFSNNKRNNKNNKLKKNILEAGTIQGITTESESESESESDGNENSDQISLGSIDNTHISPLQNIKISTTANKLEGMSIDPTFKKRQDDWAERGAAKIVKEVIDPNTGEKTRQLIKKGIKDFKFGDMIGDGAYSTVQLATSIDSGKKYAVKILNKEYLIKQKKVKYVNIEKTALQRLNNSNSIIKLFFTFQDEASLYFLLEFAPNGDFLSLLKKFGSLNEVATCYYSAQIIDAIAFLHSMGIIHRDMKPENILLDSDWKVKLTDFGTAKILENEPTSTSSPSNTANNKYNLLVRSKSFVGTAEYVSPELLNLSYADYRCDIWAFGCIVYQMIAGKPPFKATNEYLTFQKVMKVQYAFTAGFPTIIRDLVKRILIKQMDQRLSIPQIQRHHFFKDVNFKDGSVWSTPVPELSGYKMTAKSMQPVPELKGPMIYKRPSAKKKSNTKSQLPLNTTTIPTTNKSYSNVRDNTTTNRGASPVSPLLKTSHSTPATPTISHTSSSGTYSKKKITDERTAAILENARRGIDSRKQNLNKRIPGTTIGASVASTAAMSSYTVSNKKNVEKNGFNPQSASGSHFLNITPSSNSSNNNSSSNTSGTNTPVQHNSIPISRPSSSTNQHAHSSSKIFLSENNNKSTSSGSFSSNKAITKSSTNSSRPSISHVVSSKSNSTKDTFTSNENIQSQTIKEVVFTNDQDANSSTNSQTPKSKIQNSLNKQDIQWSYYLKNIDEHILKVQEMFISTIDTELLEKKINRAHRNLVEPTEFNNGRSTLLSQVARNGGVVTGFRADESILPEDQYYEISFVDENLLLDSNRYASFELLNLLLDDENEEALTPVNSGANVTPSSPHELNDETSGNVFSGKVKKFFQQAKTSGLLDSFSLHDKFKRRVLVLTTFGRLLVFARRKNASPLSHIPFDLEFDINLCQVGTNIKEVPMVNSQNNLIVAETPYYSFLLSSLENSLASSKNLTNANVTSPWLKAIKNSIYMSNDNKKLTFSKSAEIKTNPTRSKSNEAKSGSVRLAQHKISTGNDSSSQLSSPTVDKAPKFASSPQLTETKFSSMSKSVTESNKGGRLFNNYVSAREKHHKRHVAQPLPSSNNLVSGLPSTSASAILGLGIIHNNSISNSSSNKTNPNGSGSKGVLGSGKFSFRHK